MGPGEVLLVVGGGMIAGIVNTVAGGGSLLTFPLLVALGLPPLDANVTNTVGIVPAALGGGLGYRAELRGAGPCIRRLLPLCVAGAAAGAAILLLTPSRSFRQVVPLLIAAAAGLLLVQRRVGVALQGRRRRQVAARDGTLVAAAVYGGYFGAAVSVVVLAILVVTVEEPLQRLNALKVLLAGSMNLVAAVAFIAFAPVHWGYVLALAPATLAGGRIGASVARRVPDQPLRVAVVVLALVAAVWLELSR